MFYVRGVGGEVGLYVKLVGVVAYFLEEVVRVVVAIVGLIPEIVAVVGVVVTKVVVPLLRSTSVA